MPVLRLTRKQAIGIKQETTQGTAVVPSSSTDFLYVESLEISPSIEFLKRNHFRASLDSLAGVAGKRSVSVKFMTELKGSGTAGDQTVAGFQALSYALQACGMTETVVPATSITYAPTSAPASANYFGPGKSVTIEVYKDGLKHIVAGCVGTWKITAESGQYPKIEFEFQGTWTTPTDAAVPSPTIVDIIPQGWMNSTVTVHGSSTVIIDKLEIDCGNTTFRRDDPREATAVKGFVITERNPVGQYEIEATKVADYDAWGALIASTEASTSVVFGSGAGKVVTVTMPKSQNGDVQYGDRSGIMTYVVPAQFNQNTGDDWISIAIT